MYKRQIDLWVVVLDNDPEDADAIEALAQLYERARDYEKLADVLEKQARVTYDTSAKLAVLNKLGQVVGDRLKDDVRAGEAYRCLLYTSDAAEERPSVHLGGCRMLKKKNKERKDEGT